MSVRITCSHCGRSLSVKEKLLGSVIKCPACQGQFLAVTSADIAPSAAPLPGQIGRFRILAVLGQGGFGTVYRAHDPVLNREVAIKVPRPGTKGLDRLLREAQAAASLRHPHIVAVFEAGADGDDIFIATEYVDGQTLADRNGQSPVDAKRAAEWVRSLASALDYAHQQGIIHRDVKPQNAMIDSTDRAQLMDFGLARSLSSDAADSGSVVGTAHYMSPEQARGRDAEVGPRSDQYSLGVLLYGLLTRHLPFEGESDVVGAVSASKLPTAPRKLNPGISRDLEAICLKAMSPDPQDRYADCGELEADLGRWLNGELVQARRYPPWELVTYWARKRPALFGWTAAAICLLAMLIGGGTAYGIYYLTSAPETIAEEPAVGTNAEPESAAVSATTTNVVVSDLESEMLLYGRQLDRARFAFQNNDVSEANRWLEQTRWDFRDWEYRYLRRIVTGGWKTIHGHFGEVTALAIHPEGKRFVSASIDGTLIEWNIATGEPLHKMRTPSTVTSLAYSPDGNALAVSTGIVGERPSRNMSMPQQMPVPEAAPAPPQTSLVNPLDETIPVNFVLDEAPQPTPQPVPAPQDDQPRYFVMLCHADTLELIARYEEHNGPIADLAFSPDGRLIASGEGAELPGPPIERKIHVWDVETLKTVKSLIAPSGAIRRLAFSPDGMKIAATTGQSAYGAVAIWNLDPNARPVQPPSLVSNPAQPVPGPSPDAPAALVPEQPIVDPNAPLRPERVFPGSHLALALTEYQLLAAPAMDLWLLENNRRRISGDHQVVHRWSLPHGENSIDLRSLPSAVYDLAINARVNSYGQQTLLAGGDPLKRLSPGLLTLHDPAYQFGVQVPHRGHTTAVTTVVFRHDGKQFISGSADGVIKIWNAEVHPETVRLSAQPSATRVAFGKDGRYVAVAGRAEAWFGNQSTSPLNNVANPRPVKARGTVKLMDIQTGREMLALTAGPGDVLGLVVDPEMRWLAAGGEDSQIHLWNLDSSQLRFSKEAPGIIRSLAVSTDGKYVAAACGSRNPYASAGPTPVEAPQPAPVVPQSVEASSDPSDDLSACDELPIVDPQPVPVENATPIAQLDKPGFVAIWNVETGEEITRWQSHDSDTLSVAFSADGTQLATSGADKKVRLWSVADRKLICELEGDDLEIVELAFRPTGGELAGVGHDPCRPGLPGMAIVWSLSDGAVRLRLQSSVGLLSSVAYSPDGTRLATSGGARFGSLATPGHIIVWDAETGIELLPLAGPSGRSSKTEMYEVTKQFTEMKPVFETIREERLVNGEKVIEDRIVSKLVPETRTRSEKIGGDVEWEEPGAVLSVAFSGDGRSLAAACEDGSALVWDAEMCQPHDTVQWPNGRLLCAVASADGRWIATAGDAGDHCGCKGIVRIYNAVTGRLVREIETDKGPVRDIHFSLDDRRLITVSACQDWFPVSCLPNREIPFVRPEITEQYWNRKEQATLVMGAELWDHATGERVAELSGHAGIINGVDIHSSSGQILTGSDDGSVRLWDPASGAQIRQWTALGKISRVQFAPTTSRFVAVSNAGQIWMADADSAESPQLLSHASTLEESEIVDFVFDDSGTHLRAVSSSHPVYDSAPLGELSTMSEPQSLLTHWDFSANGIQVCSPLPPMTNSLDWLPDQKLLAHGSGTSAIVFDPAGKISRLRLTGHVSNVKTLAVPGGRLASFTEHDLKVWKIGEMLNRPMECGECAVPLRKSLIFPNSGNVHVTKVRYSGDGSVVATAGHVLLPHATSRPTPEEPQQAPKPQVPKYNSVVTMYDSATASVIDSITLPDFVLTGFDLSPDARYLALARPDHVSIVWDRQAGKQVAECRGHTGRISSLRFHPAGDRFATAGHDGTIRLWALDGSELALLPQGGYLESLAFDPTGKLLAVGDRSRAVQLWDVSTLTETREPTEYVWIDDAPPRGANLLGHSPWEFVSAPDHPVHSGEKSMRREGTGITQHYFDSVGRRLPLSEDDTLFAWVYLDPLNPPRTLMLQFNDGNWEHRALWGEELIPYGAPETAAHRRMGELPTAGEWVRLEIKLADVGLSPGGSLNGMSFTQFDGLVYWDKAGIVTRSPQPIRTLANHYGPVSALAFSGDGRSLAASSYAWANEGWVGDLKVWDVETGRRNLAIPSHTWSQFGIAFHPRLPYIASTGKGHQMQLFHAETGQILLSIPTLGHACHTMDFSPDGDGLAIQLAGRTQVIDVTPQPLPFGYKAAPQALQDPQELAAARWVLERGGRLQVLIDGIIATDITYIDDLPSDPFVISRVELVNQQGVKNEELAILKTLTHLRNLSLVNVKEINDAGIPDFATLPELTELNLEGLAVTGECLSTLPETPHLTYLNLSNTKLSDQNLAHLGGSSISYLFLGNTSIGDESAELLREISALELGINGTRFTDRGIGLLKGFRGNTLHLYDLPITDVGIKELLSSNPQLIHLNLARAKITDAVVDDLSRITTLQRLYLHETGMTDAAVARLKSALPKCHIEHSYKAVALPGPAGLPQPVGYWSFDNASELGHDAAPDPVHGKVPADVASIDGVIGKAAQFSERSNGIGLPPHPKFRHTGAFTLCCWATWEGSEASRNARLLGQWTPENGQWQVWRTHTTWGVTFDIDLSFDKPIRIGTSHQFNAADWHHIAYRFDGSTLALFVDGKPAKSIAIANMKPVKNAVGPDRKAPDSSQRVPVDTHFIIGSRYPGAIDDVRLYSESLSDSQIDELFRWRPNP